MRKVLLLAAVVLFSTTGLFAQKGFSFGLRVIPTVNWGTYTEEDTLFSYKNDGSKMGFGFGPSVRYKFSDNFNVDISGIFTWQKLGISQKNALLNPVKIDRTEDFKIQYLQLPLNLNGQFDVAQNFQALINFGVGFGIKLKSMRKVTDANFPEDPEYSDTDYKKAKMLNFLDIYLTAGAGVVYNLEENLHLSLTVQYNNGIIDGWRNSKNNAPSTINELNLKHKNVAFSLAFYIDL